MRAAGLDARAHAPRMYASLGRGVFELLWLACRGRAALADITEVPAPAAHALEGALAHGRGVVLAASHTGNWDLAAAAIAQRVPLLVVTKRLSMRALDAFWQSTRAALGVSLAAADGAMAPARAALARGSAVAMMIDQVPQRARHAVRGTFLGREAWLDKTPAVLAARSGAPLVAAAAWRRPDGTHELAALRVIVPPAHPDAAWIEGATRAVNEALDAFVREHPESWLWMHRRWKTPPR